MESEESLEDFKYNIAFSNICYNLNKKLSLNENSKKYIGLAKEYFDNVGKSLDSILSLKDNEGYFVTPHLKEVIECSGRTTSNIQLEDISKLKEEVLLLSNKLDNLKTNSQDFYKTKDSEDLLKFLSKLIPSFE